jgi:formylglycine-generating enzyme required for sulfatase activity
MVGGRLMAGSVWQRPVVPEAAKDALAKRQVQAAVALLRLGATGRVWPLLEHRPDPRLRSFLIHRLAPLSADLGVLLGQLAVEREVSRRRALVLSLGGYPIGRLEATVRDEWLGRLRQWYREEPDAGLHGAVEWLLRRWGDGAEVTRLENGMARKEAARAAAGGPSKQWYVNGQGQTLVKIPAARTFWMGSPGDEVGRVAVNEPLHQAHMRRSFALGAKEVTVTQFRKFRPDHRFTVSYSPWDDGPIINVTWSDAAEYCNWLSEQEDIPREQWCYLPNEKTGEFEAGMQLNPWELEQRGGYRLPTEVEWEYACRAGAVTRRYYGDADELLGEYAWYGDTTKSEACRAGGLLKPNDLGLFDLYGNALEWVMGPGFADRWPGHNKDKENNIYINDIKGFERVDSRLLRGGSFVHLASDLRSANRNSYRPSSDYLTVGFRVARTCH